MGWEDLLAPETHELVLPWTGSNKVYSKDRTWRISGDLPKEHGWYLFNVSGARKASLVKQDEPDPDFEIGLPILKGYLVGNRLIPDDARIVPNKEIIKQTKIVYLVEPGLERFARAITIKLLNKYIYIRQEFPQGSETEVELAYQNKEDSINNIPGVTPPLDLAFRWISYQRELAEKRREEQLKKAEEELEKQRAAEKMAELRKALGTAEGRRALASDDFESAAKAALSISNSELLDFRNGYNRNEVVVQYRFRNRRFECVVDRNLRIIDAGICLEDHITGERGDTNFTLESLPGVVAEAIDTGVLHVWRHV